MAWLVAHAPPLGCATPSAPGVLLVVAPLLALAPLSLVAPPPLLSSSSAFLLLPLLLATRVLSHDWS